MSSKSLAWAKGSMLPALVRFMKPPGIGLNVIRPRLILKKKKKNLNTARSQTEYVRSSGEQT